MDCREGMACCVEDNSIDAIVTDPPYGLSKHPDMREVLKHWLAGDDFSGGPRQGPSNCASQIVKRNGVVYPNDGDSEATEELVTFNVVFDLSPMGVRVVEFDNGSLLWEVEVDAKSPRLGAKDLLMDERKLDLVKKLSNADFTLRETKSGPGCVGVCGCCAKFSSPLDAVLVRFCDDSFAEAERSTEVMAFLAAEMVFVLTFDVANRTAKLHTATGADKVDGVFSLVRSEAIGTSSATRRLPPVGEPDNVCGISTPTNGAFSFNLVAHAKLLDRLEKPTIPQKGFMGRSWDSFVPGPLTWEQAYRALKPGAWAVLEYQIHQPKDRRR